MTGERRIVNLTEETWQRLQAIASPFRGSERGTPEKVIAHLLDMYERTHLPPNDREKEVADKSDLVLKLARETAGDEDAFAIGLARLAAADALEIMSEIARLSRRGDFSFPELADLGRRLSNAAVVADLDNREEAE